jgi:hypothetical protein
VTGRALASTSSQAGWAKQSVGVRTGLGQAGPGKMRGAIPIYPCSILRKERNGMDRGQAEEGVGVSQFWS